MNYALPEVDLLQFILKGDSFSENELTVCQKMRTNLWNLGELSGTLKMI